MDVNDRNKELAHIIDSLSRRLDFLDYAGVRDLPASAWTAPAVERPAPAPPAPRQASSARKAPAPEAPVMPVLIDEKAPVALFIWRLGGLVAFVEGISGAGQGKGFPSSHIALLERLAGWMAGELGVKEGFSAKGGWSGEYTAKEAGAKAVAEELRKTPPRMVVTLGPVAAGALLGNPDVSALRGSFHDIGGLDTVATHSLGAMLKAQAIKKEAHNDLLMALGRLK